MKGAIIINAFFRPKESVRQAERMQKEFAKNGVKTEIISDGFLRSALIGGKIKTEIDADFILFLDKDKYLSAELEKTGFRLFNRHSAIRACDDKGETYLKLSESGLNIPDTVFGALSYSADDEIPEAFADRIINRLNLPLIVKESFGSMGKGVYKADDIGSLIKIMNELKNRPHIFQKIVGSNIGEDIRVIVIGGKAIAAMRRKNKNDFRSNVALGGKTEAVDLSEDFIYAAERAAKILSLDYCGVDILDDAGSPYICEVNSNAFFEGIEMTTGVNIAALYADYIIKTVNKEKH